MNLCFADKEVTGLLVVMPTNENSFLELMDGFDFPRKRSLKLMEVMGYGYTRLVNGNVCASDLAVHGLEYLFNQSLVDKDELDALILVTQSPDHFVPPTSNIIQSRLRLKQDLFCMDINQGCAGFVIGLIQAFMMLEQSGINKVAVVNSDVLTRKISKRDRNSYPLAGDAASIVIVETRAGAPKINATVKMDGSRYEALRIPAGGFRLPSSPETAELEDVGDGNYRAKDHLCMDGTAVFNFVQSDVPPMIDELLKQAEATDEEVDYYMFHQPNRFMLEKLADKMNVSHDKMPSNVVGKYGNSSGVTIPVAIVSNLNERLLTERLKICLAGFGVGLTWSSMLLELGELDFCKMIGYP
ncbi:ketoacyl-ACP synthase III [Thermodesulfobacteriota bacterium]